MNKFGYRIFRFTTKLRSFFYLYYNRVWFSIIGIKHGKHLIVQDKLYVIGRGNIFIGNNFIFTSGSCINPISRNVRGAFYVPNNNSQIIIGNNVGISSSCIWAKERITIGDNVNIGGDCLIMDNDAHPHNYILRRMDYWKTEEEDIYLKQIPTSSIEIGDDVWIGARCQILKGVHIGPRSIIAAGSVVTNDIPADCVAGGNPCRVIRLLNK